MRPLRLVRQHVAEGQKARIGDNINLAMFRRYCQYLEELVISCFRLCKTLPRIDMNIVIVLIPDSYDAVF